MANRSPSPVLPDLSDPKLRLLKPFLDWLKRSVVSLAAAMGPVYTFSHPAFSVAGVTTRRLWTGYVAATAWAAADGWKPRYVVPEDGELVSLAVQHGTHTGGPSAITYTVWVSRDGGLNWRATPLVATRLSNSADFAHVAAPVPVSRGDMFGVEAICAGAATGTDRLNATVVYRVAA